VLARAEGGAEVVGMSPIDLRVHFQNVRRTWSAPMQLAMLHFQVEMPKDDLVFLGDANSLQRLLSILLENAAKYTPPGGSVILSAAPVDQRVCLSVRDTGIGIADEHLSRIFDRFYRAAEAGDSSPRGSGLGLALGRWIAERHGTQLTVESKAGRGSCFSFPLETMTLPLPVKKLTRYFQR
jgi:signal transduction histidine kinase